MRVSNRQVAARFAEGEMSGSGSHMFISGDCVYSYGHHFCIARRYNDKVLFTLRSYSNSTAKHKLEVLRALRSKDVVMCPDPAKPVSFNMKMYDQIIKELKGKMSKARTRKASYEREIAAVLRDKERYDVLMGGGYESDYKRVFDI